MKKKDKYLMPVMALILILLCSNMSVRAAEEQAEMKGSIEIILTDGDIGTSKSNVVFEYDKVADVVDGKYILLENYKDVDLNSLSTSNELDNAAKILEEQITIGKTVTTDKSGKARISDLEIGVYLLRVKDKARYENVTPVLIAIPTWNEAEKDMLYDVTVIPKHTPNTPGEIITKTPDHTGSGSVLTGDSNLSMVYLVLLASSATVLSLCVYKKRRGRNAKKTT